MLKVLDLFSGIGGFSLGLERTGGFKTVAFCEIEPFCQKVLRRHWPDVPIHDDVRQLNGEINADVITGGYPCQPFSNAGKRRGEKDDRHLWPEMYRIIGAVRPRWVIAENVAGHISMGLDTVLSDLEAEGYTCWVFVIPACAVDAPHRRDRVWIVARLRSEAGPKNTDANGERSHSAEKHELGETEFRDEQERVAGSIRRNVADPHGPGQQSSKGPGGSSESPEARHDTRRGCETLADTEGAAERPGLCEVESSRERGRRSGDGGGETVADRQRERLQRHAGDESDRDVPDDGRRRGEGTGGEVSGSSQPTWWLPEPPVGRVAHGIPGRVDRLKGLGNAVVPQIPEMIGRAILESEKDSQICCDRKF